MAAPYRRGRDHMLASLAPLDRGGIDMDQTLAISRRSSGLAMPPENGGLPQASPCLATPTCSSCARDAKPYRPGSNIKAELRHDTSGCRRRCRVCRPSTGPEPAWQ
ncbi:hypothetical protein BVG79_00479 [Ketogulonicigenium robustum]|uniref:Uncharacterized protein n=1 Tax=Ketogulonicigenium robustum TaxID=92947 RepID=A0A1W6NXF0_9RHOB|nr:hypothetical protein BVG79_00479 [Ketogulonicigenium robustum]